MLNDQTTAAAAPATPDQASEAVDTTTAQDAASAEQLEQLLVLSQAPLTLDVALELEAERVESSTPLTAARLMAQYSGLLCQVLGVGLVTAAIRHYGAAPSLYLGAGLGGGLLFAVGATVAARQAAGDGWLGRLRFAGLSVLLGLGLGLLVGGALHFSAFPRTGAVLVPVGVALSIAAFVLRDGRALLGRDLMSAGVTIAGLLVWLSVGLGLFAKKMDPPPANAGAAAAQGAAATGDHSAAAGGEEATAAAAAHGEAANHDAAAGHGDAAAKSEHGAAAAAPAHAAAAATDEAAADHGTAAKTAEHDTSATSEHATEATASDHAAPAASATQKAPAATGHGAAKTEDKAEEDEVTADDVLAP